MFNAILSLIGVVLGILADTAKKLLGWAFLAFLLTLTFIVTSIIVLDHFVG